MLDATPAPRRRARCRAADPDQARQRRPTNAPRVGWPRGTSEARSRARARCGRPRLRACRTAERNRAARAPTSSSLRLQNPTCSRSRRWAAPQRPAVARPAAAATACRSPSAGCSAARRGIPLARAVAATRSGRRAGRSWPRGSPGSRSRGNPWSARRSTRRTRGRTALEHAAHQTFVVRLQSAFALWNGRDSVTVLIPGGAGHLVQYVAE
ncbi:hypothetical protein BSE24067_05393 [Burkholderia seminalis]|nr:hypothetical protein BSE24067_05393 [Burkholderia seminalis]